MDSPGEFWFDNKRDGGRLYDVRVMRNKFDHIGIRPDLFGQGGTLEIDYAETAEVTGGRPPRSCSQPNCVSDGQFG